MTSVRYEVKRRASSRVRPEYVCSRMGRKVQQDISTQWISWKSENCCSEMFRVYVLQGSPVWQRLREHSPCQDKLQHVQREVWYSFNANFRLPSSTCGASWFIGAHGDAVEAVGGCEAVVCATSPTKDRHQRSWV